MTTRRAYATILVCALLAYATTLLGALVYDDVHTVRDNTAIRTLANVPRYFVDVDLFSSVDCRMYRPLVLVSYALDYAIGQGAVWVFKLTNLLLHVGVAMALYRLVLRLRGTQIAALLAACVFAAHPLASEAVNTISGRSELGAALGIVIGLSSHLRARDDWRWLGATTACAALACGCKEIGVILPALMFVLDPPWRREGRLGAWVARHALPGLVVLVYLVARRALFGQATTALPPLTGGGEPLAGHGRDMVTQLSTMATVLPRALAQCVVPVGLSLDPPIRFERSPWSAPVLCGVAFVGTVLWLGWRGAVRDRLRRTGMALACCSSLPWIALPLNLPYLEHRMYVPLAGLVLVLAAVVSALPAAAPRVAWRPRRLVALVVLAGFATLSTERSLEYRDATTMWRHLLEEQPGSVRALCGLAVCYMEQGDLAAALPLVQRAVAIWPTHVAALRNLAELHLQLAPDPGNAMTALVVADTLVRISPRNPFDRLLRSRALAQAAQDTGHAPFYDDAEREALHCLVIAAPKSLVYRTAAAARTRQGEHARALVLLDASIAAGLVNAPTLLDRLDCLRRLGRGHEADVALQQLLRAYPFDPAVLDFVSQRAVAPPK